MTYQLLRPRMGALILVLSLLVLALGAAQARADGEDDLPYGTEGTAFQQLGAVDDVSGSNVFDQGQEASRVDQGPDGSTVQAVGLDPEPGEVAQGRGEELGDDVVRVIRRDPTGVPAGLDGDGEVDVPLLEFESTDQILDVEVLDDGTIVVLFTTYGEGSKVYIVTMNQAGEVQQREDFQPEGACEGDGYPIAGEIASATRSFVVWQCDDDEVLAKYELSKGWFVVGETVPDGEEMIDLDLAPDGDVYVLVLRTTGSEGKARGLGFPYGVVFRYDQALVRDTEYGGHEEELGGEPLAIGVDGAGRAAVWTDLQFFRGSVPWAIFRLDATGAVDESWGDTGLAYLQHEDLGPVYTCPDGCFPVAELLSLADGRVIAMAFANRGSFAARGSQEQYQHRAIARTTAAGALDAAWDGDGVRVLALGQPDGADAYINSANEPDVQTDGKVLVPNVTETQDEPPRMPAPPDGWSANVTRLNRTPPVVVTEEPKQDPQVPQQQQPQQQQEQQQQPRKCISRRQFRIRLRKGTRNRKARIVSARVTVNGKKVKVTRSNRLRSRVNLRRLPKGRYVVRITVKLSNGKTVRETRRYRTCTRKIPHQLRPLRGR